MTVPSPAALRAARVGNEPGFTLTFQRVVAGELVSGPEDLVISSDEVHGEIRAALPDGLKGGAYSFTIERLRPDEYGRLSRTVKPESRLDACTLALFWRDTVGGVADYLGSLVGMPGSATTDAPVATLAVTGVSRAVGRRGIETTITCRERVFERTAVPLCGKAISLADPDAAMTQLLEQLGLGGHSFVHPLGVPAPEAAPAAGHQTIPAGTLGTEALRRLAHRAEERTNLHGRGMLLIRDDVLYIGPRPIPFEPADGVKELTAETGLIEVEPQEPVDIDPNFDRCADPAAAPPQRGQYRLTLKGRPDLKPGDVVSFTLPPEEELPTGAAAFGVVGLISALFEGPGADGPLVRMYVASVEHRLGRATGFVTTATGVALIDGTEDWDVHSGEGGAVERPPSPPATANPETEAADAVTTLAQRISGERAPLDVGEVRAATTSAAAAAAQTLLAWRGLVASDGLGAQGGRLPVQRPSASPAAEVPYLTPFAFGKAGLVLPRYPGTRLAFAHRLASHDDPLAVGALWEAGSAPDSQPGDWWLILPTEVADRESVADDAAPAPYSGAATDDLTDADGNRIIEVGELTVRVGAAALQDAGSRPERAADAASVTIEHADGGSRIVMGADGSILIEAATDLTLKAANVKVEVSGTMDVSG